MGSGIRHVWRRSLTAAVVAAGSALLTPVSPAGAAEAAATPTFSHDRGFYTEALTVTLATATPDAQIRYTTDGKAPTSTSGAVYDGPVPISKSTVLRAIAHRAGLADSTVESRTYIFVDQVVRQPTTIAGYGRPIYPNLTQHDYGMDQAVVNHPAYSGVIRPALASVPTISIAVDPADIMRNGRVGDVPWWGDYGFYDGTDVRKPMSAELIDPAHPEANAQVVGMVEGHAEPKLKRSLRLRFSSDYGTGYPSKWSTSLFRNSPLNGGSAASRAKTVVLRAGNNAGWANSQRPATFTEDQWFRDTQLAASGFGSHGTFVHLYINGLYWGLYNAVERPDEHWQAEYFGGDNDDFFAFDDDGPSDWDGDPTRFLHLTEDLLTRDMSQDANYAEVKDYVDVAAFADYLAIEFYMQNMDWPANNFKGGHKNTPPGPTRWFAWDGEMTWQTGAWVHPAFLPGAAPSDALLPRLWHALRVNPEFMLTFADRVHRLTSSGGALSDEASLARWDALNSFIRDAVVAESARWGDALGLFGVATRTRDVHWQHDVDRVRAMTAGNGARLVAALRASGYYPATEAPVITPSGGTAAPGATAAIANPNGSGSVYYTRDGSDPRAVDGTVSASAQQYTAALDVSTPVTVKARVLDGATWSAAAEADWQPAEVPALRVTELMYNPTASSGQAADDLEFAELQNVGNAPVDLAGISFAAGITFDFTGAAVSTLDPGARVVVARNPASFGVVHGGGLPVVGPYTGKLANEGELLRLADSGGRTIQEFAFSDQWYPSTDGGGYSLTIRDSGAAPEAWSTAAGWRASSVLGGTPGVGDDLPVVSVSDVSVTEGDTGTVDATFHVTVDRPLTEPVTLSYSTQDGTATAPGDYTPAAGEVTFTPGGPAAQDVTVSVQGDGDAEPDETFRLVTSVTEGAASVSDPATATILTDDPFPLLSVGDVSTGEGTGAPSRASFAVTVDRAVTSPVQVAYRTRDMTATSPADYAAATGTVQFTPGGAATQVVDVDVHGDSVAEGAEQFELILSDPVGAEIQDGRATCTIVDDDTSAKVSTAAGTVVFEDSRGRRYSFQLNVLPQPDVWRNRGVFALYGTGTFTDGQYWQRNNVISCGPACVTGTGWALFKSEVRWRVDNSTTPSVVTVANRRGRVVSGAIAVSYAP